MKDKLLRKCFIAVKSLPTTHPHLRMHNPILCGDSSLFRPLSNAEYNSLVYYTLFYPTITQGLNFCSFRLAYLTLSTCGIFHQTQCVALFCGGLPH